MHRRTSQADLPSPALARLGLATPPPFVGRSTELAELKGALAGAPLVIVKGAVGSGKTRLAGELMGQLSGEFQVTRVACAPGDLGVAVVARCERAMDRRPGTLQHVLETEAQLLVIDDVHHLDAVDIVRLVNELIVNPGGGRLLLLTRDVLPLPRNDARRHVLNLEGLDEESARDLWTHLEELYGPTSQGSCDQALTRTRGMPLAMRREYSRSRYGEDAWELDDLSTEVRFALEAVSVARLPAAPAAIAALLATRDVESALIELVSRQLIDPLDSGRFAVHDVVRDQVLEAMDGHQRTVLEMRAVDLVRGMGRGVSPQRPAWTAGDDGAIALVDEVDRAREVIMHLIAAGHLDAAAQVVAESARGSLARGAGGELLAQIQNLRSLGYDSPVIRGVAAQVAVRHGRVAEAIDLGEAINPVLLAFLYFRSGDTSSARTRLEKLCKSTCPDTRAYAAAALAELELTCGRGSVAEQAIATAFEDRARLSSSSLAALHLAFAEVESHKNNLLDARAALARAGGATDDSELSARVLVRQVRILLEEQRYSDASKLMKKAKVALAEVDSIPLRDELIRCEALRESRVGSASVAAEALSTIISAARNRGDEVSALRTELELALLLAASGRLRLSAEIVVAAGDTASRYGMHALVAQADLVNVSIALKELRINLAQRQLEVLDSGMLSSAHQTLALAFRREVSAWQGNRDKGGATCALEIAQLALAAGDSACALQSARSAAISAERLAQPVLVSQSMAIVARLELARGDRDTAMVAASRAARESVASGCILSQIDAFLVLSALARDSESTREAAVYARDARTLACEYGLPVQKIITGRALDIISSDPELRSSDVGMANACVSTASEWALTAAETQLSDLGFSSVRPYRCVSASGVESFVASASPELLGMQERALVVDAVRQVIIRNGKTVADLRRRSLLKRLLFLFSSGPTRVFSKEEIVEMVWDVEYHPLRHDAALFTNIMRIRRLLGADGIELIQVSEEGYALVPPNDFLFVEEMTVVC